MKKILIRYFELFGICKLLHSIGMVYLFLGISIAADKFMEAISVITSKTKTISIENVSFTLGNNRSFSME